MVEQALAVTFHPPKVPEGAIVHDGYLRHLGRMECKKKSPRTFEDKMRRSAYFGYGRIGFYYNIPSP